MVFLLALADFEFWILDFRGAPSATQTISSPTPYRSLLSNDGFDLIESCLAFVRQCAGSQLRILDLKQAA